MQHPALVWLSGLMVVMPASAMAEVGEAVAVDGIYVMDAARGRNLGVKLYHPATGDGPWPVILFSHGLGGSQWGYAYLGQHWAQQGWVSIHVTHPGSDWTLWDGRSMAEGIDNLRRAADDPAVLAERPGDLVYLLDHLTEIERQVPALIGHLDAQQIGIAGHSLGADTALRVIGVAAEGDARVAGCLAMSPQAPAAPWRAVSHPVLLMTGTRDDHPFDPQRDAAWRLRAWDALQAAPALLLVLPDAHHLTFAGGGFGRRAAPDHLLAVQLASDAFWRGVFARGPATELAQRPQVAADVRWESK
jgi:predicted dienelactone hydrolase